MGCARAYLAARKERINSVTSTVTNRLLNVKEVASQLRISERNVWTRASKGELPAPIRIGRLKFWRGETIEAWLKAKEADALREQERLAKICS